ncbi:hypothetical protein D5086_008673 [Populus alba]|uniref:Uncharacterized protein n=1 Tax=Populus alba TaxID=43335 RepID=A0ACC4CHN4_POPAL
MHGIEEEEDDKRTLLRFIYDRDVKKHHLLSLCFLLLFLEEKKKGGFCRVSHVLLFALILLFSGIASITINLFLGWELMHGPLVLSDMVIPQDDLVLLVTSGVKDPCCLEVRDIRMSQNVGVKVCPPRPRCDFEPIISQAPLEELHGLVLAKTSEYRNSKSKKSSKAQAQCSKKNGTLSAFCNSCGLICTPYNVQKTGLSLEKKSRPVRIVRFSRLRS